MTLRSVVGFFAHPDDETLMAGGMIALMAQQGIPVHIVCCTRGEGGEPGDPPVVARPDQLGAAREVEVRCAAQALGASLTILDYVDPIVGPDEVLFPFEADFDTLARQFVDIVRKRQANVVLMHGSDGEYGHPAHQLVYRAVMHGIPRVVPNILVYSLAALVPDIEDLIWNKNEPAHLALDIRPWAETKLAALECHVSQHAMLKRRGNLQSIREAISTVESVRRQWPDTHGEPPDDAFARLLRTAGAWENKES